MKSERFILLCLTPFIQILMASSGNDFLRDDSGSPLAKRVKIEPSVEREEECERTFEEDLALLQVSYYSLSVFNMLKEICLMNLWQVGKSIVSVHVATYLCSLKKN